MSDASNKKAVAAAAAAVAAAAADPNPIPPSVKRKRTTVVKKEPVRKAIPHASSLKPIDSERIFVCTDHPVLFGGRPGVAVCARDEDQARKRTIEELERRGIKVEGKISFRELGFGEVFMFQ